MVCCRHNLRLCKFIFVVWMSSLNMLLHPRSSIDWSYFLVLQCVSQLKTWEKNMNGPRCTFLFLPSFSYVILIHLFIFLPSFSKQKKRNRNIRTAPNRELNWAAPQKTKTKMAHKPGRLSRFQGIYSPVWN